MSSNCSQYNQSLHVWFGMKKREGDHCGKCLVWHICRKCKAVLPITMLCTVYIVHYHVFTIYITCAVHYSQLVISLYVVVDISSNTPYTIDPDLLSKRRVSDGLWLTCCLGRQLGLNCTTVLSHLSNISHSLSSTTCSCYRDTSPHCWSRQCMYSASRNIYTSKC